MTTEMSMTSSENATRPMLPLFYREPQLLHSALHGGWRLKDGDAGFAAEAPFVPVVVGELAAAARFYPVVFAAGDAAPVAVLGLDRSNLFVADGRWKEGTYVPAYVRRYPFGFIATRDPEGFALAIDGASDRVLREGDDGVALFEAGEPSAVTRQAMQFCQTFLGEARATERFAQALTEHELLVDRRADATLPDGRKLGMDGFRVIDRDPFLALAPEVLAAWHGQGWLALAYHHLASLDRFADLLALQAERQRVPEPSPAAAVPPLSSRCSKRSGGPSESNKEVSS